jgi:DNA-binding PadR family transcriptional regulator
LPASRGTSTLGTIGGLSDTEYAVLGLLTFGERSGYELDKLAARSIGYFWRPAKSKIYEILPRLVDRGFVEAEAVAQEKRPDKQLYRITSAGEEALGGWLESGRGTARVRRDGLLLKLFFASDGNVEALRSQVAARKRGAEEKLETLERIEAEIDREEDFFPYVTLLHGLEDARATIAWAERALALLDERARARNRARA